MTIMINNTYYDSITPSLDVALRSGYVVFVDGKAASVSQFMGGWLLNGCPLNVVLGQGWLPGQSDALQAAGLTQCINPAAAPAAVPDCNASNSCAPPAGGGGGGGGTTSAGGGGGSNTNVPTTTYGSSGGAWSPGRSSGGTTGTGGSSGGTTAPAATAASATLFGIPLWVALLIGGFLLMRGGARG